MLVPARRGRPCRRCPHRPVPRSPASQPRLRDDAQGRSSSSRPSTTAPRRSGATCGTASSPPARTSASTSPSAGRPSRATSQGQIDIVRQAIQEKPDAIVLAAADFNLLVPLAREIKRQGIPLVCIDSFVNSDDADARIGTDNYEGGQKCAAALMRYVQAGRPGRGHELREGQLDRHRPRVGSAGLPGREGQDPRHAVQQRGRATSPISQAARLIAETPAAARHRRAERSHGPRGRPGARRIGQGRLHRARRVRQFAAACSATWSGASSATPWCRSRSTWDISGSRRRGSSF